MAVLQACVNRYIKALSIPKRLIAIHPGNPGNPGNASAIAPTVVLTSISAFEGFVEDITAAAMVAQGISYNVIARVVGNWTNPDIKKWGDELNRHFAVDLAQGFSVRTTRGVTPSNWSATTVNYQVAIDLGSAWMNVRHALTHGEVSGSGAELWPTVVRTGQPPSDVLRVKTGDATKHHLQLPGARGCAALYTYAARRGADLLITSLAEPALTWSGLPMFDPAPGAPQVAA